MCAQGMHITRSDGSRLRAFKPAGWVSNSPYILDQLNKQCNNLNNDHDHDQCHAHSSLENGKASRAAMYPEQFCYSILSIPNLGEA